MEESYRNRGQTYTSHHANPAQIRSVCAKALSVVRPSSRIACSIVVLSASVEKNRNPLVLPATNTAFFWPPAISATAALKRVANDDDATATSAERAFARRLAMTVRGWLSDPGANSARGGPVRPEHVLVLVRRRQPALIAALVSALQQAGVPVAGPDRLLLTADLAVRDMLSLARFAVQPGDDLALCEVLTSPMGGLDHDQLTTLAHGRGFGDTVWQRLRDSTDPAHRNIANWLRGLLASVDYDPPAQWLRKVLDHPQRGSRAITARLGGQALDSLGELLNAAHEHAREHVPVMRDFLRWLLAHEAAIKRDPDAPRGEVRIMTVHAAKGLQAPIVILADATARPRGERDAWLPHDLGSGPVPIFHGGKARLVGPLEQAAAIRAQRTAEEELRLLYVAMTRAEDQLFVGGALSARDRGAAHAQCWWSILRDCLADELQPQDAMGWPGQSLVLADPPGPVAAAGQSAALPPAEPAPAWLFTTPAPPEPHARPLRPSRLLPLPPGRWEEAKLMDWLCDFIGRGSSLDVPVREMPRFYQQLKAPVGDTDVLFITDCLCRIPQEVQKHFLEWKQSVKARLITLVIASSPGDLALVYDEVHIVPSLAVSEAAVERVLSI